MPRLKVEPEWDVLLQETFESLDINKITVYITNYSFEKASQFANFVYFCIFGPNAWCNFRTHLQGYIFRILLHFATKLCNFTHFSILLPGMYFFWQVKKISLWWELSVLMHSHILVGVIIIFIPYLSLIAAKHRYPCHLN